MAGLANSKKYYSLPDISVCDVPRQDSKSQMGELNGTIPWDLDNLVVDLHTSKPIYEWFT